MQAGRMGHTKGLAQHLSAAHFHQHSTVDFLLPPSLFASGGGMYGDVGRSATVFRDGKAIEMAAISRCGVVNERWRPKWREAPVAFNGGEAVAERVDEHESVIAPADVMGHHWTGDMATAAEKSDVVLTGWLDLRCKRRLAR